MTADLPEIMRSLNQLFTSGNVLYFNISNTSVWIVVMCNDYARHRDSGQFSVFQGRRSAADPDLERNMIPICLA
ncbi:norsolorinic acid reductase [Colletotrichum abscissum]|uniref:Norsolorinic acid reductase n=1 Tax=Colletotrichum abscissum TaxID=1671311 RepID=A0A9Q0B0L2_9PEZI|nr:norsolorinic acid reductase [Colletotrichum abscissum]KAI3541529.1 norsolorinic acid reductase [Colletotrichum abscissum]KAK1514894.1 norsolorinic acid reductase [Colletotrichum abscissum]